MSLQSTNFITNKYRILGKIGEGTFSEVLKCQHIKDGTYWAAKKMKQQYESFEQVNNLREVQAMRRLSPHPNILELHEVLFDKKTGTLVLICELMDKNIYELIRGRRHFLPEQKVKSYIYQLLKSVEHLHRNGIFHRDVKPENILIKDDQVKLADFGSCRSVQSKQPYTEYISTRWYRAPECLLTDGFYSFKMDIWSVGCVFFEILSLHPLFPGSNEVDQIAKIHDIMGTPDSAIISKLRNKTRGINFNFVSKKGTGIEKLLSHASQDAIELIILMCHYDPDERISAKSALKHPYFKFLREADKRAASVNKHNEDGQQQQLKQEVKVNQATNVPAYLANIPVNLMQHRDPVYHQHRTDKKRRKVKQNHSDKGSVLPRVGQIPGKASSYQGSIGKSSTYQGSIAKASSYQGNISRAGYSSTSALSYLPSITQAFTGQTKLNKVTGQGNRNIFRPYQLPSIDRSTGPPPH